jgi:hypothetical protein
MPVRIDAISTLQGLALGLVFTTLFARPGAPVARAEGGPCLFRVVTMRGDLLVGVSRAVLAEAGPGAPAERLARLIDRDGEVTAWRYAPRRAGDGGGRLAAAGRVRLVRQEVLMLEAHEPAVPAMPLPAG